MNPEEVGHDRIAPFPEILLHSKQVSNPSRASSNKGFQPLSLINRSKMATLLALAIGWLPLQTSLEAQEKPTEKQLKFFESQVRPILVEHCYACHSSDSGLSEGDSESTTKPPFALEAVVARRSFQVICEPAS